MKIAYTGWTWIKGGPNVTDEEKTQMFEQSMKEIAYLGYDVAENFAFISDFISPEKELEISRKYNLPLVNVYGHFSTDVELEVEKAKKQIDWLAEIGGKWFNCQSGTPSDVPDDFDDTVLLPDGVKLIAEISNRVGEYAKSKGITLCFHPHACTYVFSQEQIDFFAEHTNPEYVSFCIDTAHTTLAGIDPVKLCEQYADRIGYMHLKDVDPEHVPEGPRGKMGAFRALGLGTVNFKGVVNVLKKKGYDGVLCVELDNPEICNFQSAQVSREYIRNVLKL